MPASNNLSIRLVSDAFEGDDVRVADLTGREHLSQLFSFHLTVVTNNPAGIDADKLMSTRVSLRFEHIEGDPTPVREIHGIVSQVQDGLSFDHDHATYRVTFVPRMWLATLHETLDIHMDLTVPEIITKVLKRSGLGQEDVELRLRATYPKREFVVQYQETDLAFVSRIAEHHGIYYFFEHADGADKVIFSDHNSGFQPIVGDDALEYNPHDPNGLTMRERVLTLESTRRLISSRYVVRDYNYRSPGVDLLAASPIDDHAGGDIVEYGAHFKNPEEGKRFARIRAEEVKAQQHIIHGQSNVTRMTPGATCKVVGHPRAEFELIIVEVNHSAVQSLLAMGGAAEGAGATYDNTFVTIPKDVQYRAPRVTPKPKVSGIITGIIDATQKSPYAELDADGRYKVRFMYDTSEAGEGQASRPVRMSQPHSGPNYGQHFPMRAGTEVIISCIDGDPDRPIIAGTVPNPANGSPVTSGNTTRNVIRTGGSNEINMDDTGGSERVKISTPNADTMLQMGAPESPEHGALLSTSKFYTGYAGLGISTITSVATGYSKIKAVLAAKDIITIAGVTNNPPAIEKIESVVDAIADVAKESLEVPKKMLEVEKAAYDKEKAKKGYEKRVAEAEAEGAKKRLEACDKELEEARRDATAAEFRAAEAESRVAGMAPEDPARPAAEAEAHKAKAEAEAKAKHAETVETQKKGLETANEKAEAKAKETAKASKVADKSSEEAEERTSDYEQHGTGKNLKTAGVVKYAPKVVKGIGIAMEGVKKAKEIKEVLEKLKGSPLLGKLKGVLHMAQDNENFVKAQMMAAHAGIYALAGRMPGSPIAVSSPYHLLGAKGTVAAFGKTAVVYGVKNATIGSAGQVNVSSKGKVLVHSPQKAELAGMVKTLITSGALVDTLSRGRLKMVSHASSVWVSKSTLGIASKADMTVSTKANLKVNVKTNATIKVKADTEVAQTNFKLTAKKNAHLVAKAEMKVLAKVWGMEAKPGKVTVGGKGAFLEVNGGNTKIHSKQGATVACNGTTITAKGGGKIDIKAGGVASLKGSKVMLG
jgi:type VI secretion system VgrG family protein